MAQASATSTVTVETVRDYIVSRGGVVKNVDLVKHFRSFLQQEDPEKKGMVSPRVSLRPGLTICVCLSFQPRHVRCLKTM